MTKRSDKAFFTEEQLELIKTHILEGAPEHEIQRFVITCERTGLDPFSRQIYGRVQASKVKRGQQEVWIKSVVIMTSIDGLRSIAERSGEYAGQTHPEWWGRDEETGKSGWCQLWLGRDPQTPDAARVGVYRKGHDHGPTYGVARYLSFVQYTTETTGEGQDQKKQKVPTAFWKKMPDVMLSKCAEASALRKAFPLLLSGIYIEEEFRSEEDAATDAEVTAAAGAPADLPPGTTWVPGHSPAERGKAAATEKTVEPPAPENPTEGKKGGRGAKKETATPPPAEKKPAASGDEQSPFGSDADPAPPADPAPSAPPAAGPDWPDHTITQISVARYKGKKVGELSKTDIGALKAGWVDKYAEQIKKSPEKSKEAAMIMKAYAHHFPA